MRVYTYVDSDPVSRKIARSKLQILKSTYPTLLSDAAIKAFDKRLPQSISLISPLFLSNLVVKHGPIDLLGGSWECHNVSRARHQRGLEDPRFRFFYDMVRVTNFLQWEQTSPLLYLFENTWSGSQPREAV